MVGGRYIMSTEQNIRLAAIFHLDGVVASNDHVMHHIKGTDEPDWDSFNEGLANCEVNDGWATLMQMMWNSGYKVIILTNRAERLRTMTEVWLKEHDLPHDDLVMRPDGTPYEEAKEARLDEVMRECIVMLAVDDDPTHCDMYESKGIPTLYAHSGYYVDGVTAGVETADVAQ
jgi:hypothetical protein